MPVGPLRAATLMTLSSWEPDGSDWEETDVLPESPEDETLPALEPLELPAQPAKAAVTSKRARAREINRQMGCVRSIVFFFIP